MKKGVEWEQDACSLLQNAENLFSIDIVGEDTTSCVVPRLEHQVLSLEAAIKAGVSLGLDFNLIPKLQDACSMLEWCIKAISFSSIVPTRKEVEMMLDAAASLPGIYKSCALWTSSIDGLQWLKKSLEILDRNNHRQHEVSSIEEVLVLSKEICISFPLIIGLLQDAVQDHNLWLEQVHLFFGLSLEDRSWNLFLQLKDCGSLKAFDCVELEKVLLEFEKVQKWKQHCTDIVRPPSGEEDALLNALIELKNTLDRSFEVYSSCKNEESKDLCIRCSNAVEDHDLLTCSMCKDSFHFRCAETVLEHAALFICPYCNFMNSSKLPRSGCGSLRTGRKHLALDKLIILLSDANNLCLWTEERRMLHQIVEKALECNACLMELVNFALAYLSEDLDVVKQKMCVALKAIDLSGICDDEGNRKFELALARNSWKIRAQKLLQSVQKPTLQQIQHHLEEGQKMRIPSEDYFTQKLTELRDVGLQWADTAKKVSLDGGVLGLDRVFELIYEGEQLPVHCVKELKLLRDRSMLYCICRRPYDQRAMIACDKCDEWYHFDCIKISSAPKVYICPACNPHPKEDISSSVLTTQDRCTAGKFEEPHTPLRRSEVRRNSPKPKSISKKIRVEMEMNNSLRNFSSSERLLWRQRKPFRRAARKRSELQSLSPFFYVQNKS